jgi:hypothetical protein
MDTLLLLSTYAGGFIALLFAARHSCAGWLTVTFAWIGAPYLAIQFVALGLTTHSFSPLRWTGEAQTGPLTLFILVLALSAPLIVDWDRDGKRG